tara:strand:+ start:22586 stop:23527 length:942 start_codon:yes stop_codon:yes gene_type:complete
MPDCYFNYTYNMPDEKPTLAILAAGMGSRYGGLKQMDVFTPDGDSIIDFSIFDALAAGFGKFVFIVRRDFEKEFKAIWDQKLKGKAEVVYVYQELDSVPKRYRHSERKKPWGTGHALLILEHVVTNNFAIINADDFYGAEAFQVMAKYLQEKSQESYAFSMMGYALSNTLSDYGSVSRGECEVDAKGFLKTIIERTHIEKIKGELVRRDDTETFIPMAQNTIVSMNFWGFTPKCFEFGQPLFTAFLEENKGNIKAEFYIPTFVSEILKSEKVSLKVLKSDAQWFGVTYQEDKPLVKAALSKLKEKGFYPKQLW